MRVSKVTILIMITGIPARPSLVVNVRYITTPLSEVSIGFPFAAVSPENRDYL